MNLQRPYLVVPHLVEQPTWGGDYIVKSKKIDGFPEFAGKKIGQSYELSGGSRLFVGDTSINNIFDDNKSVMLADLVNDLPIELLGQSVFNKYHKMPLLIKLNQARGNSFQLHVKQGAKSDRWTPKPESWYFISDGYISCGINPNKSSEEYKDACGKIAVKMRELSEYISNSRMSLDEARKEAKLHIDELNPEQYVQLHKVEVGSVVDLSGGGVHHSWEDDPKSAQGNIIYEVQMDVPDEKCTIRSFDQGKIMDDGGVREVHINDYFDNLDRSPRSNDFSLINISPRGDNLLKTPYYSLDFISLDKTQKIEIEDSFQHLYVLSGSVNVLASGESLRVESGSSCFIPFAVGAYSLEPLEKNTTLLKTYINN